MALAGIETLHPDVYVIEEPGVPRIIGVGVNTGGFVGVAKKGVTSRAELVTSVSQFYDKFGGYYQGSFLEPSVRAFFNEGGTRCFVVRVLGLGALTASAQLANHEAAPMLDAAAISAGAWGNDVSVNVERWRTILQPTAVVQNGSTLIAVSSLRNVQRGDLIVLEDLVSATKGKYFVFNIIVGTRELVVRPILGLPPAFVFPPASTLVHSSSAHRLNTLLALPLANGDAQATLRSVSNLAIGARMYFDDGANYGSAVVERIDGLIIRFAPIVISGAATLPANTTIATSLEFNLYVYENGRFSEQFEGLSTEPTSTRDYFQVRLYGEGNESKLLSVVDLFPPLVDVLNALPEPVINFPLTGGTEGAALTDADYIGSPVAPKSGIFLLDEQTELNFFSVPGITLVTVEKEAVGLAERRGNLMVVLDAPVADDDPMEIINIRNIELNVDSSYAALYYPWLIVRDPVVGNQRLVVPPSGHVQGKYAETGVTRGVQFAPANVALRDVLDLTHNTSDGEQDLLNPIGINVIRSFMGEGIRIWGARTLTNYHDGRHYVNVRRILNYVKESLRRGLRFAVFELNEPRTWESVRIACSEFLQSMFLRGQLFSQDGTVDRAYFVRCDSETNPMSEIREGRMNVEIGINPPIPAEFVIVRVGLWDGGTTIEEELARR